jgi:hypothetical protein
MNILDLMFAKLWHVEVKPEQLEKADGKLLSTPEIKFMRIEGY